MSEAKHCPYCGDTDPHVWHIAGRNKGVACICGAKTNGTAEDPDGLKLWNTRVGGPHYIRDKKPEMKQWCIAKLANRSEGTVTEVRAKYWRNLDGEMKWLIANVGKSVEIDDEDQWIPWPDWD